MTLNFVEDIYFSKASIKKEAVTVPSHHRLYVTPDANIFGVHITQRMCPVLLSGLD